MRSYWCYQHLFNTKPMKTTNQNSDPIIVLMLELSIFFLLCVAVVNAPHAKGQTIPDRGNAARQKVQQIYTSQIGIREQGTNSGPQVLQYLSYVNLPKGNPWCAAFVCWVYGQANVPNPRTAWSPDLFKPNRIIWERAENRKVKVESSERTTNNRRPGIGDVFGIYFPDKKRIAHVGFVDQWDGTWLITVEGNTNVSGNREGDGVYRKRRPVQSIYQVARYIAQP